MVSGLVVNFFKGSVMAKGSGGNKGGGNGGGSKGGSAPVPNLPSKTGNTSGGGRGNAPPSKTSK